MTTPLRVSAVCCTSEPTSVTGATKPASGMEMNSTGMDQRAQSTTFWLVTSLHLSGAVGQQEKTVSGFSRRASAAAAHGELQVLHDLERLDRERAGDDRLLAVEQAEEEAVAVRDRLGTSAGMRAVLCAAMCGRPLTTFT